MPDSVEELKQNLKKLNKARQNLPKDAREEKAELSREIKSIKKRLNAAQNPEALAQEAEKVEAAPRSDYQGEITVKENDFAGWDDFVNTNNASRYHVSEWKDILAKMGREVKFLSAKSNENETIGVLPIALTHSRLFGNYAVSLPYFNYGGPIGIADNVEDALIQHAYAQLRDWKVDYLELRDVKKRGQYHAREDKVCMKLSLQPFDSIDNLFLSLNAKVRSQAKKSLRDGLEVSWGGLELVEDYYRVFAHHMRDLGTPVYAKSFFTSILETFPNDAHLVVGYIDQKPVSCAFLLEHNNRWEIPWASTLRSAHRHNANMALYARILEEVIARKGTQFDFGRSSKDAPTYKFKKQWGAVEQQLYWYYSDPSRAQGLTTENAKFSLAIKAWQKLPVGVSKLIGPSIVRNLP